MKAVWWIPAVWRKGFVEEFHAWSERVIDDENGDNENGVMVFLR